MFTEYWFTVESEQKVPWDSIFDKNPVLGTLGAILLAAILIIIGAKLLRTFWNRFIVDVFNLREITFQESLSVLLIISIFTF
jgi:hypothetical protein